MENTANKQKLNILYARLSKEDALRGTSYSIQNQRSLLEEYAERNGFVPYIFVEDDGFSGVYSDRPGWQEVLSMVEAGKVACIMIKDLSRMYRNYLKSGLDRELFKEKGVRLIAVDEGYDSKNDNDDFTPIKELAAEWHARDTSRKVKSSVNVKGKKGEPLSSKAPYGYYKDPADKNNWLVDDYAAGIVRRIFDLTVNGSGPFEIARMLHGEKIEKPSVYLAKMGYVKKAKALKDTAPYAWSSFTVAKIIESVTYTGSLVNFRYEKPSFKSRKFIERPREDWLIFEGHHEAIIDKETWELAQKLRETKRRADTTGEANPLTGLVFCHDCGSKMYNHRGKGQKSNYVCGDYKNSRRLFDGSGHCSQHYVTVDAINDILLDVVQRTTSYVRENEDEFVKMIGESSSFMQGEKLKSHTKMIAVNEQRIAELDMMFHNLYSDKVKGIISEERFIQMSETCESEYADLKEQNAAMQAEVEALNEDVDKAGNFISLVRKYTRIEELTTPMLYEFIDKVVVHEAVWSEATDTQKRRGTRSQTIDVYLKYIGRFEAPDAREKDEIEKQRKEEERLARVRGYKRKYNRRIAAEKVALKNEKSASGSGKNNDADNTKSAHTKSGKTKSRNAKSQTAA